MITQRQILTLILILSVIGAFRITTMATAAPMTANGDSLWAQPNVLILILDTTRRDRLGCYGNRMPLTPHLDRFAKSAFQFDGAFSTAPWTLPAIASLYTSRYPGQHGAGGVIGEFTILAEKELTLAEVMTQNGYQTGIITNVMFLTGKFGMSQGFASVDSYSPKNNFDMRRAGKTTDAALAWIGKHSTSPYFLVVHYYDPHLVYDPPQPFRSRFADPRDGKNNHHLFGSSDDLTAFRKRKKTIGPELLSRLAKLYMGEIAYVDQEVGRLVSFLDESGMGENTVVVVTADHGEEFADHGNFEHGHSFYNEVLQVPLLIDLPAFYDRLTEQRITDSVSLIDVAPTLCELCEIKIPESFGGQSLVPLMAHESLAPRSLLAQSNMWAHGGFCMIKDDYKLIQVVDEAPYQLFNMKNDQRERTELSALEPKRLSEMTGAVMSILKQMAADGTSGETPAMSEKEKARLRSLGYFK
jgi:arylsulfatase A-like enzyme